MNTPQRKKKASVESVAKGRKMTQTNILTPKLMYGDEGL